MKLVYVTLILYNLVKFIIALRLFKLFFKHHVLLCKYFLSKCSRVKNPEKEEVVALPQICTVKLYNFDVIVLTETWLDNNILSSKLFDKSYTVSRSDREDTGFHNFESTLITMKKKIHSKRTT